MTIKRKDPAANLDYLFDWTNYLGTDTIEASTWIVPDGLTLGPTTYTAKTTTVWLSGGTLGEKYVIANRITTVGGRIEERSFRLDIVDR